MSIHLLSPKGFKAAGLYCGIKSAKKPDIGMLVADAPASAAAVFTTNQVVAAPILVGRQHVSRGKLRAVVVNSGNANSCTGAPGMKNAIRMCRISSDLIGCGPGEVLPSSTGIIGRQLPMPLLEAGIPAVFARLGDSRQHADQFAAAIMTTDLKTKTASAVVKAGRQAGIIAGVCKGSGMIGPRVGLPHATMLAYLTTDVAISPALLRKALQSAADDSFNCVTVDDQASTNDTCCILASGQGGLAIRSAAELAKFSDALKEVCQDLARQIAADGEGAQKLVTIRVHAAASKADAAMIARGIANSPLVKCAMHGNDPNWGRIVCAAGMCSAKFDPMRCRLAIAGTQVFSKGQPVKFDAAALSKRIGKAEVLVDLWCGLGKHDSVCWTCDLSREYIAINADYHT